MVSQNEASVMSVRCGRGACVIDRGARLGTEWVDVGICKVICGLKLEISRDRSYFAYHTCDCRVRWIFLGMTGWNYRVCRNCTKSNFSFQCIPHRGISILKRWRLFCGHVSHQLLDVEYWVRRVMERLHGECHWVGGSGRCYRIPCRIHDNGQGICDESRRWVGVG